MVQPPGVARQQNPQKTEHSAPQNGPIRELRKRSSIFAPWNGPSESFAILTNGIPFFAHTCHNRLDVWDATQSTFYYYNQFTQEVVWDKPPGFKRIDHSKMKALCKPELRAALTIQGAYRMKQARAGLRTARGKMLHEPGANSPWSEVWDEGSQASYYYNYETDETVWVKPEELMTDEEKQAKEDEANMPEWIDVWDPAQSTFYYYNQFTGDITWDKPEGHTRQVADP